MKGFPTGLTKYMDVSIGSATSVDDVKNSLVNYGSISTAIMSSPLDIHHILFPQNAAAVAKGQDIPQAADKCPYNGKSIDHAVTIVGWTPCTVRQDLWSAINGRLFHLHKNDLSSNLHASHMTYHIWGMSLSLLLEYAIKSIC